MERSGVLLGGMKWKTRCSPQHLLSLLLCNALLTPRNEVACQNTAVTLGFKLLLPDAIASKVAEYGAADGEDMRTVGIRGYGV